MLEFYMQLERGKSFLKDKINARSMATSSVDLASTLVDGLHFMRMNSNLDSAYNSDESPTLISPLRCNSCHTIPRDGRRLPCGHLFCVACSTSATPDNSLTLYCPTCGDQSIAPFEMNGSDMDAKRHATKEAWTRLQTFSEACRLRIDHVDRRRSNSPALSNMSEFEELEESLNAVLRILQNNQTKDDRSTRILGDLRDYESRLQRALNRLNSPDEGEHWRRSFADAKTVLRTLSTRAKLEYQRLENDRRPLTATGRRSTLGAISNGTLADARETVNGIAASSSNSSPAQPWTISVTGEGSVRCRRNTKSILMVTAKNGAGDGVHLDRWNLSSYIVSASTGKRTAVVAIRETSTHGTYELSYYLTREGSYYLIVKFSGQHIGGSPFPLRCVGDDSGYYYNGTTSGCSVHSSGPLTGSRAASGSSGGRASGLGLGRTVTTTFSSSRSRTQSKSPTRRPVPIEDDMIMQCGTHGRGSGQFSNPQGLCCTSDGRVIVADSNNQCVQIFDAQTGECKLKFGKRGRSAGEMQRPTGVAVLPMSGNILVADYDNRWISVHDPNGKYLGRFGSGKLLGPRGITVDNDDHVIVVDNKASTILVYDLHKLKFVRQFGSRGDRMDQLAGPHYCAVNASNNLLYMTDFHHHCVKVFDCRGQYQFGFGSLGEGNGQFQAPTGIAIDANQNVLVADWGNSRIQVFDHSGSFLSYVNSGAHQLFGPQGLAMTADGNVAVADTGNHCYKIYRFLS